MTLRPMTEVDRAAILAFLRHDPDWSMFPLANLVNYGMGGAAPYQMRFWAIDRGREIAGLIGLSGAGMLLPVFQPGIGPLREALPAALAGEDIAGIIGKAEWARALAAGLGLEGATMSRDADEPAFSLDLCDLAMPDCDGLTLHRPGADDKARLLAMRAAYHEEVFGAGPGGARAAAERDIAVYLARGSHRLLFRGDEAVAMTGFNAVLPEIVQIGGVYVPPSLRRQKLARAAVALHLAEARAAGTRRAVLFAASDPAARAYRAIGFRPTGRMAMILLDPAMRIAP